MVNRPRALIEGAWFSVQFSAQQLVSTLLYRCEVSFISCVTTDITIDLLQTTIEPANGEVHMHASLNVMDVVNLYKRIRIIGA